MGSTTIRYPGTSVQLQGQFLDVSSLPFDPASVRAKVKLPSGAVSSYTYGVDAALVKDNVGVYHLDILVTTPGTYFYRFESDNDSASFEGSFAVKASNFP